MPKKSVSIGEKINFVWAIAAELQRAGLDVGYFEIDGRIGIMLPDGVKVAVGEHGAELVFSDALIGAANDVSA